MNILDQYSPVSDIGRRGARRGDRAVGEMLEYLLNFIDDDILIGVLGPGTSGGGYRG